MNTPMDPPSPYQPPAADLSRPVAQLEALAPHERSGAPKVFGVLSIVFSSLVLLASTFGVLWTVASSALEHTGELATDGEKAAEISPMFTPAAKIQQGLGLQCLILFVMSLLLLAIGIGQLRYRAWARRWSVYWGAAGLACVVLLVAISLLIISPAYADLLNFKTGDGQRALPESMGAMSGLIGGTFAITSIIFYTPYPAIMLLFFTRDRVRASMTS